MRLEVVLILLVICGVWGQSPQQQAQALWAQMTQQEKLNLVHGWGGSYVGDVPLNARLNIPALNLQDGPQGVGDGLRYVTTWPASITCAATWDVDLMYQWASAMAQEQKGKGTNIMLGPDINIARVPMGGRIFEMFGEDPVLTARMATASVTGIQSQGVVATAKHFIDNDQEYLRNTVSITVDQRTQWEIYYYPFIAAVQAGVGSIMCSYNRINATYACENTRTLSDLKNKMGFKGWVMSDWGATHSTAPSALAGLDMEMSSSQYFGALGSAITSNQVPQSRLDDMVMRILTSLYAVGVLKNTTVPTGNTAANVSTAAHNQLAYTLAANSITLLKNDGILPLTASGQTFAVLGDAPSPVGGGSGAVTTLYFINPVQGITTRVGTNGRVVSAPSSSPTAAAALAANASYAIVVVSFTSSEGSDRSNLQLSAAYNTLITSVAAANPNTIVVLYGPGPILMPWVNSVRAILFGYFAGQELGNALANVLFGDVNPSGKLPVSFPVNQNDWFSGNVTQYPGTGSTMLYSEKLLVGYRWYDHQNIAPLFPFGHGLSYTTFSYSDLNIIVALTEDTIQVTVEVDITNTGPVSGSEVVQLYLSYPPEAGEPPKVLRGFNKISLAPTVSTTVTFNLQISDISIYDETQGAFSRVSGTFQVLVGSSSRDIRQTGSFYAQ